MQVESARKEIHDTLRISSFCFSFIGVSLTDDSPKDLRRKLKEFFGMIITFTVLFLLMLGQYSYVVERLILDAFVGLIAGNVHNAGYGFMSQGKLLTIWYKQEKFRQLVRELAIIWPVDAEDMIAAIKRKSLSDLKRNTMLYTFWNGIGILVYIATPIVQLIYHKIQGNPSQYGYIFRLLYPFDKTLPIYHELAYVFECCAGILSVAMMLGTDLLFMIMTSHISMLLLILQQRLRSVINEDHIKKNIGTIDCYKEILNLVKIHQRLIDYANDLEGAFAAANLINVLLSSLNICSCTFNIVFMDPWVAMNNKFFLGAALTQMGIICWYAEKISEVSTGISDAVYESAWYRTNVRSRRALLVMLQRSQKPLYFTALKFSPITMATYSSILTTSYSYFTLIYSSFK